MATMAATIPSAASSPPTPPSALPTSLPAFARVTSASLLQRNASTSSSRSTTTSESTSSLVAVPIRPPPIQTRTAATPEAQLATESASGYASVDSEPGAGLYGGRGFHRQGPRMARQATMPVSIATTSTPMPGRSHTAQPTMDRSPSLPPNASISPTTPKAKFHKLARDPYPQQPTSPGPVRVMIATDDATVLSRPASAASNPTTPTHARKPRSVNNDADLLEPRERRSSQASNRSNGSAVGKRPSLNDYILGEELGRGSYSTVVHATQAPHMPMPRLPNEVAIKIMSQHHLIQEKKAKYAHIERDALIRLAQPRSPTMRTHRRGMSNSSTGSTAPMVNRVPPSAGGGGTHRDGSGASANVNIPSTGLVTASPSGGLRDRQLAGSCSPRLPPTPLSPLISASMRLAKSGDSQSQEVLDERASPPAGSSRPSSPVQETGEVREQGSGSENEMLHPRNRSDSSDGPRPRTPRKRRQSLARSDRSTTSSGGAAPAAPVGHPGIIRLYSTFVDKTSVYYVLELASNGELASMIRKYGSLDLESSRFYAAQLIDTIEYIHEREIIHRDLKPENILLDSDMRIRVTDFGSAKIIGRKEESPDTSKRSFVGSAEYVSPEILNDKPVSFACDIWGFGVVLYNFITGTTPFRSATEYLTFQKVLHRDFTYPEGFDEQAKNLVDQCLNLDPTKRPTAHEIKSHPFFSTIDWGMLWQVTPPTIHTGITPPQTRGQVALDSSVWAAFEDDDESEGADREDGSSPVDARSDGEFGAVRFPRHDSPDESTEDLDPPRPAWMEDECNRAREVTTVKKTRGWSTSSSSSAGGRLSVWLESMGINTPPGKRTGSSRASRYSDRSEDRPRFDEGSRSPRASRSRATSPAAARTMGVTSADNTRWMPLMVANERIILSTPIMTKADSNVPSFLLPVSKRRQLILTDLPRLLEVKDDPEVGPKIKHEFMFLNHPHASVPRTGTVRSTNSSPPNDEVGPLYILEVQEKTNKVFILQTPTQAYTFAADTPDIRAVWMHTLRKVV